MAIIKFYAENGILQGKLNQEVSDYSELIIPTPITNTYLQFIGWDRDIPTDGKVESDESYKAQFEELPIPVQMYIGNEVVEVLNYSDYFFSVAMSKAEAQAKFANVTSYIVNETEYSNMRLANILNSDIDGCAKVVFIQLTDDEVKIEKLDETINNSMEAMFDGLKIIADPDKPIPLYFPMYVRANMFYIIDKVRYVCVKTDIVDSLDEEHFELWDI